MTILTRYAVCEMLKPLAVALIALTALLSIGMAGKEAVRHGIPPLVVVQSLPFFVLEMLGYSLPAAALYAVCSVFGRMSSSQELTALKSVGVNPIRMVEPVLAVAAVLSLASVMTYELTAVWSRPGIRRLITESAAEIALGALRTQRSVSMPWGAVHVQGVEGHTLLRPCIRLNQGGGDAGTLLIASRGELTSDDAGLRLTLHDFNADIGDGVSISHPGVFVAPMPGATPGRKIHRDWLAMGEIPNRLEELAQRSNEAVASIDASLPTDRVAEVHRKLDHLEWKSRRLSAEPYRRWANGFSCVAFTLIGIPIAMRQRNPDAVSTFFVAFLPILVAFYPLLMVSENLALSGWIPAWGFWGADALLAGVGVYLLRRATKN